LSRNDHPTLSLTNGDTVIFSARTIPGNEEIVAAVRARLEARGVTVLTPADAPVLVSGNPARDDLKRLYGLIRPRFAVPVHGTLRHLEEHARLARACGVERALVPEDGDLMRLADIGTAVVGRVDPLRLAFDGRNLVPWTGPLQGQLAA
jgi:ribonuclease J